MISKKTILLGVLSAMLIPSLALADGEASTERSSDRREEARSASSRDSEVRIDRRERTNPYPATPFSALGGGEASRYRTDQAWSRGRSSYWYYGSRRSDIPTTGYTAPPR
jgi:hypothetical protein